MEKAEDDPSRGVHDTHMVGVPGFRIQPGPSLAAVAIWSTNSGWKLCVCLCPSSLCMPAFYVNI